MRPPTALAMCARAERRAMIALVAVFVLLVQALVPTLASAGTFPGEGLSVCTQAGLAPSSDGGVAPLDHDCQHCVCPAATIEPPPIISVRPVAYADSPPVVADTPRGVRPWARAPPRPPGQGPPPPNA